MPSLKSHKIILGVTGGISAYKACELVRLFKKAGHQVRVIMTKAAEDFVSPLTLATLSEFPVLRALKEGTDDLSRTSHIDLAQWGDVLVVAPATANFLAKYRAGIADDALTTEALAFRGEVFLAPAMNTRMWNAPVTQENCAALQARGVHFIGPEDGQLACGEIGLGKMAEPQEILTKVLSHGKPWQPLKGKKILITSGPTRSYIDSVRYFTNRSSGRMGHALAVRAEELGAEVVLVVGPVEEKFAQLKFGKVDKVETGAEMLQSCLVELPSADIVIAAAAVADFGLEKPLVGKMRREGVWHLNLTSTVDVLAELGKLKQVNQVFLGFAAEVGEGAPELEKGFAKIKKKNLDILALNNVARNDIGFDTKDNEIFLLHPQGEIEKIAKASKAKIADVLLAQTLKIWQQKNLHARAPEISKVVYENRPH